MNAPWHCRLRAAVVAAALLTPIAGADAQEFRATISGRVTDPQGATVPGAAVTVTSTETNAPVDTVTNDSGNYTVAQLQPGGYTVTVELSGFRRFVREGLTLRTAEKVTVNVQLQLGNVSETLTVVGGVSSTDSNESTLAQTMENKRVAELPLNGRQVYMLLQLTAGTFFTQTSFGSTGFSGTRAWDTNGSIQIHGSRTGNNEFLIDGAPNSATGGWQYAPPVDAIEEFKVQSASVDASYGRTGGGVVNMALKAGTNQLRGSTFLFYRGNALDANTTQNNRNGIKKTDHRFVDGGAVVSGPIRSGKTFFMAGYQGFNENIPFPRTSTVPTAIERAGDFSQTRNSQGQLITIFDPLTTRPDPDRAGRFIRDPFPGNRVPADRINPVALQLLGFVPKPNVAGEPFTAANNLAVSPNLGLYRYNSYLSRIDHHFSPGHRVFFTSTANWGVEFRNQNGFPIPALRGNWPKHRNHYMETLDDVFTINPTTLLNVRASFDRFNDYNPITYASLPSPLGIRTPFQVVDPQYPYVTIDGYQDFFPGTYGQSVNNIYSLQGNVSKTWAGHFLKMGGDFRSYRLNRINLGDGNGRFDFSRRIADRAVVEPALQRLLVPRKLHAPGIQQNAAGHGRRRPRLYFADRVDLPAADQPLLHADRVRPKTLSPAEGEHVERGEREPVRPVGARQRTPGPRVVSVVQVTGRFELLRKRVVGDRHQAIRKPLVDDHLQRVVLRGPFIDAVHRDAGELRKGAQELAVAGGRVVEGRAGDEPGKRIRHLG